MVEKRCTFEPEGRIPIYKLCGCVPLIFGKDFSVPVAHPQPASHRVPLPPPPRPHTIEDRYHTPAQFLQVYSINH